MNTEVPGRNVLEVVGFIEDQSPVRRQNRGVLPVVLRLAHGKVGREKMMVDHHYVGFSGTGCAISTASASLMTQAIKGMKIEEAEQLFKGFREMVTSDPQSEHGDEDLGKLSVFSGVREFPMRVKCATLAWHAMSEALHDTGETATTE